MDPSRARALYEAGLGTPYDVLNATEGTIKAALSRAMPSELKRRDSANVQKGTYAAAQIGKGAHIGTL